MHFKNILIATFMATATSALAQSLPTFPSGTFGDVILPPHQRLGRFPDESRIGSLNIEPITTYGPDSIFLKLGHAVGRLDILTREGNQNCTAFLVSDDLIMTNHHCVPGRDRPPDQIWQVDFVTGYIMDYVEKGTRVFKVDPRPVETNAELDYSLLRIIDDLPGKTFGTLDLSADSPSSKTPLWIIGHPLGQAQTISREKCAVASQGFGGNRLRHTCDTLEGNSGSPVFDAATHRVVALHASGVSYETVNGAVPMSLILSHSRVLGRTAPTRPPAVRPKLRPAPDPNPRTKPLPQVPDPGEDPMLADINVQTCDRFAGHPDHPDRTTGKMREPGVAFEDITPGTAIRACSAALAAFPNHPRLLTFLGRAHDANGDDDEARWHYGKAAGLGDVIAQFNLAHAFEHGNGGPQDLQQAAFWYEKAAAQGHAISQRKTGETYLGRQTAAADGQAAYWFEQAAGQGDAEAERWLGWLHEHGRGVRRDDRQAVNWYRKAVDQGNAEAHFNLGWMYEKGRGVPVSPDQAALLHMQSLRSGCDRALTRSRAGWSPATVRQLQIAMKTAGVYRYHPTGVMDEVTFMAMRRLLP